MEKKCSFCGNKNFTQKKVQYLYKGGDRFLFVNDVPCEECDFCGEQYFKAGDLKKIEKTFNNIGKAKKKAVKEIKVPVEEFAKI
ncbi:MAG: YgiT-type zinc finger protein [Nitrospinae bacterium]|nr:YgiT-type zinc finger protein [Nitrospinota bacterium]